jgi:hypothetical protein
MTGGTVYSGVTTDITTGTDESLTLTPNGTGTIVAGKGIVVSGVTNDITTGTNEDLRLLPNGSGLLALRSGSTNQIVMERGSSSQIAIFDLTSAFAMSSSGNQGAILLGNDTLGNALIGSTADKTATTLIGGVGDTLATAAGGSKVLMWGVYGEGLQATARRQSAACVDNAGAGGVLGGLTLTPTSSVVYVTNTDVAGCIVTISETGAILGSEVEIVVVSNAGGTITFPAAANVHAGPTFATTTGLDVNDSYRIHYADMANDLFVGVSTSDN